MPNDNDIPQFDTAQYATPPSPASSTDRCFSCNQPIAGQYYRVNGKIACDACTDRLRREKPASTHSAFVRGLLFGIGAAAVGLVLYATFTIVTGFYIGYVALGVGWMVGKAIMAGSKGMGGRRYQIAALMLTYAAISLAEIPILIHAYKSHESTSSSAAKEQGPATDGLSAKNGSSPEQTATDGEKTGEAKSEPPMSFGAAVGKLVLIGLASPFLELQAGVQGVIGLVILFVGLRIAWQITRGDEQSGGIDIHGPYSNISAASAR